MKIRFLIVFLTVFLTLQLVSCSSKSELDNITGDYYEYSNSDANIDLDVEYHDKTEAPSSTSNDLEERKIIKNANIDFETKEYDEFLKSLSGLIELNGGYIQSQDSRGSGVYDLKSSRYSNLTVRIPEANYNGFIGSVGTLGSMTRINEYQNDVTMSYIDIESHIKALQAEYDALIAILEKSKDINDIITVQSRISDINYQLDSLKSQLRKYDDLISYCTVNISVSEVKRETPNTNQMSFGERISAGLKESFADILDDFSEFTVWFVVSLPYLLIWGIIITLVVLVITGIKKRRQRKAEIRKIDKLCEKYSNEQKKD